MYGDGGILAKLVSEFPTGNGEVLGAYSSSGFGVDEEEKGDAFLVTLRALHLDNCDNR